MSLLSVSSAHLPAGGRETMDASVFALVLLAAACHAAWNAVIKREADPFSIAVSIAVASMLVALPLVPFTGFPPPAAWPWLAASVALHVGYWIGLTEAYRTGDMGQVYPIARGSAPLMTAGISALWLAEALSWRGWTGIALLAGGVILLSLRGGRNATVERRAVGFALMTSAIIAGYSVVDGVGARVSQNPHTYTMALFVFDGLAILLFAFWRRGAGILNGVGATWKAALAGGVLSLAAYWIAIWAMTVAPIAIVAALRETSVLFAAAIAVGFLGEPLRPSRLAAAAIIVTGLVLIRLA